MATFLDGFGQISAGFRRFVVMASRKLGLKGTCLQDFGGLVGMIGDSHDVDRYICRIGNSPGHRLDVGY